jgi:hypothetical protein
MQSLHLIRLPPQPAPADPSLVDQLSRRVEQLEHRVRVIGPLGAVELRDLDARLAAAFSVARDRATQGRPADLDRVTELAARVLELTQIRD